MRAFKCVASGNPCVAYFNQANDCSEKFLADDALFLMGNEHTGVASEAIKLFKTAENRVLREADGEPGKRFYSKFVLETNGKQYYLTSQWFDKGTEPILQWLAEHGISRSRAA